MVEVYGLMGSTLLAVCAVPQCIHAWRGKSLDGLSWSFLALWGVGEILLLVYNWAELGNDPYLLFNYSVNLVCIGYLLWKKLTESRF